jgi:hypothetical protein
VAHGPDPAPFRLVPDGAGNDGGSSHKDRQEQVLQQASQPDVQQSKTTPKTGRTAKTGSGAAKLRQSFIEALEARLQKA